MQQVWTGSFETVDLSQWSTVAAEPTSITLESEVAGCPEATSALFRVDSGQNEGGWGSRAEVIYNHNLSWGQPGQKTRLVWNDLFESPHTDDNGLARGFRPVAGEDTLITDLHSTNLSRRAGGGVNVTIRSTDAETFEIRVMGGRFEGPLPKGVSIRKSAPWATAAWGIVAPEPWGGLYAVEHSETINLGAIKWDKWTQWVLEATPSTDSSGALDLFVDGELVATFAGPNLFSTNNVTRGWTLHSGIYRPSGPKDGPCEKHLAGVKLFV